MKELSTRERLFVVVFALAAVWGAWNFRHVFTGSDESGDPLATSASGRPVAVQPAAAIPAGRHLNAEQALFNAPNWSKDPFNRPWRMTVARGTPVTAPQEKLTLSAIVVRPQVRYAVINGKIVREGQAIAGRQVIKIEQSAVILDDNGIEVTLSL